MDYIVTLTACILVTKLSFTYSYCRPGDYKCNPNNLSTFHQCSNNEWISKACPASNLEWSKETKVCVEPGPDTVCSTDPVSNTTTDTSAVMPASTVDLSTQCPTTPGLGMCPCTSPHPRYLNITHEELEEILEQLKKELTLKKQSLARYIRRNISAADNRTSSQVIGFTGALMLATPLVIILLSDLMNVLKRSRSVTISPA